MPFVIRRTGPSSRGYFMGLGGGGRFAGTPNWDNDEKAALEAERFDTETDARDHANLLFPASVSEGYILIEEVSK